ncbi:hypothetical protein BDP27DRAFT_1373056 [Rhodocollybia butyracea]|uniref:Uncharacterized protein n=1 Tax=Rhodocollybia butyracea TaxID=206335 RepID=A0A9P5P6H4_9AGAR|nr:hypothetical protein BDP27DRAFT_1373056 [Rhodocollybia butyracea]
MSTPSSTYDEEPFVFAQAISEKCHSRLVNIRPEQGGVAAQDNEKSVIVVVNMPGLDLDKPRKAKVCIMFHRNECFFCKRMTEGSSILRQTFVRWEDGGRSQLNRVYLLRLRRYVESIVALGRRSEVVKGEESLWIQERCSKLALKHSWAALRMELSCAGLPWLIPVAGDVLPFVEGKFL